MNCPKCHSEQKDSNTICDACGLVFAKYYKYHGENGEDVELIFQEDDSRLKRSARQMLFHRDKEVSHTTLIGWTIVLVGLTAWSFLFISSSIESNYVGQSFMHLINLPFHEAGHIFFRPFGSFLTSLGGSLLQIIMPVICLFVFLFKTRDPFAGSVALWWSGQNFLDIAPYINDARAGQLPLLGGNFGHSSPYGFHDWEFILNESGLLAYDQLIARFSFFLGSLIMITALTWGGILVIKYYKKIK
jgi:hypothetical protein